MTSCYLIACGQGGAALCEAALWGCVTGTVRAERLCMVVAGADAARLTALAADYAAVREAMDARGGVCGPQIEVRREEITAQPLTLRARDEQDRLLCKALFTREEAGRDMAENLRTCGPVAKLMWTEKLRGEGMTALDDMTEADEAVLCGSLCDAACAAGADAVRAWLADKLGKKASGIFLLPIRQTDDAGLCRETLSRMRERDWRALCLAGMPEDCRDDRAQAAHLTHWMAALCLDAILAGLEGGHSVRVAADGLDWADFGQEAARYREAWDGMAQAAWLLESEYGPVAIDKLESPNWLRDRMGWYAGYFAPARKMPQPERAAQAETMRAGMRLMGAYAAWLRDVCEGLPAPMLWADSLEGARQASEAHYQQVLDLAGQLALLTHDAEVGDMANERFVHRHDMADSAAEATMRRIGEMQETLEALAQEQEALDKRIGGREQRSLLMTTIRRLSAEANELRAQAEDARRRIERSAQIATPEEMPRVEVARSKLERLMRHLSVMDGRTARAEDDLRRASEDAVRNRAPEVTEDMQITPAAPLYDLQTLQMMAQLPEKDAKEQKKLASALSQRWLWAGSAREAMDDIARRTGEGERSPAGQLLHSILTRGEGGSGHAEGMDDGVGAPA